MQKIRDFEWSIGNGQCPACHGQKPDKGWWTDTVGHREGCVLAEVMRMADLEPEMEHPNPERSIGNFVADDGLICMIRYNDPDKEEKLGRSLK